MDDIFSFPTVFDVFFVEGKSILTLLA